MIAGRLILHGHRDFSEPVHWDLLTSTRRIWRNRLKDCSLGNIERQILGVQRFGDIPGAMIPDLYFAFLRNHDPGPLRPVFSHNHEDIVSLARLADQLVFAHQAPSLALSNPVDQLSFGVSLVKRGQAEHGLDLILPLLDIETIPPALRTRAARVTSEVLRRNARYEEAIEVWERMLLLPGTDSSTTLYPLIELAKTFEHRYKDYQRSIGYVERAWNLIELNSWHAERVDVAHRYARLVRRLRSRTSKQ
jgi:uncharacterized protein